MENFTFQIGVFFVAIITISITFVLFASISEGNNQKSDRVTNVKDASNLLRFYNNVLIIEKGYHDKQILLWGLRNNYHDYFVYKNPLHLYPHNSILSLIAEVGIIYFIIYILLLSKIINRVFKYENYEYIYSFLIFITFLHNLLVNISLMLFLSVLFIKKRKRNNKLLENIILLNQKYIKGKHLNRETNSLLK